MTKLEQWEEENCQKMAQKMIKRIEIAKRVCVLVAKKTRGGIDEGRLTNSIILSEIEKGNI